MSGTNPLGFVLPAVSLGFGALLIRPQRGFFPSGPNKQGFKPIIAQATLEEIHRDELEITEHPVEYNAIIADHAYKRPLEIIIRCAWSNSTPDLSLSARLTQQAIGIAATALGPVVGVAAAVIPTVQTAQSLLRGNASNQIKDIYSQLVQLQNNRVLFDVITGKRNYFNMLLKSLTVTTDRTSENALMVIAQCREVILVSTQLVSVTVDASKQAMPDKTGPIINAGKQLLRAAPNFNISRKSGF